MWRTQWKCLTGLVGGFLLCYYLPVGTERFNHAVIESLELVKWYAREHVLLCLIPAFFIAGAIAVFVSQRAVMRYLGPKAKKWIAYLVASVSGAILAVCSCTILPLFAGIYKMGAGLGPASAFLYSGPAINIMAIVLTARVLGVELGIARAVGAIGLSIVIGVCMHLIFRREEQEKARMAADPVDVESGRPLRQNVLYIGSMIAILVFANLGKSDDSGAFWLAIWSVKWYLTSLAALVLGFMLVRYYGMKWWKLACVAVPVVVLAVVFPDMPLLAFTAGFLGIGAASALRRTDCRTSAGPRRAGRADSFRIRRKTGRRQLSACQLFCRICRSFHVFCDPDGGPDSGRSDRSGHGERSRSGAAAGRTGALVAEHAGHQQCDGAPENGRLRLSGHSVFHPSGIFLRELVTLQQPPQRT